MNYLLNGSANTQEWSFDLMNQNTYTGNYFQVWSDKTGLGTLLACRGDTGFVGIGTNPSYKCHIKCTYDNVETGLHLDADDGSANPNKYALTIWPYVIGAGSVGWKFRTQSTTGGVNTPLEFTNAGSIRFKKDIWHCDSDGNQRLYFANVDRTYIKGYGTTPIEFRSGTDFTLATFSSTGNLNIGGNELYIGPDSGSSRILLGGGAAGDAGYTTSVIESRLYSSTENTELLLFKGNDIGATDTADRIRLRAGAIVFDTYPGASVDRAAENIRMVINGSGNVGIANNSPIGPLTIGNSALANNDGFIVLEKCTTVATSRQIRIGLNASFDFAIGDYGANNTAGTWIESFKMAYNAPVNSLVIIGTGNVGIGVSPADRLHVSGGNILSTGDIIAYYSDERLKNINSYIKDVLPTLDEINVFKYNSNDLGESFGYDKDKEEIGLSAQEIQKHYPELINLAPFDTICDSTTNKKISKSGENYLTLNYTRLVPILLQGIKELNNKNKNIDKELSELKEKYTNMEEELRKIKTLILNR